MNHMQQANALYQAGRYQEALPEYERLLAEQPNSAQALYLRTRCLHAIEHNSDMIRPDRLTAIADDYSRVLAIDPKHLHALNGRGTALLNCNRLDEAISDFSAAIAIGPNNASVHSNLGIALQKQLRINEAEACLNRAIAINSEHRLAKFWLGKCALLKGNYRRGLPLYEARRAPDAIKPTWLGQADVAGRTVILDIDGGYGDAIQFCRYVPMVKALGADVILAIPDTLTALMRDLPAKVVTNLGGTAGVYCPLQSLPLAFKTEPHSIPNACPYPEHASAAGAGMGSAYANIAAAAHRALLVRQPQGRQ